MDEQDRTDRSAELAFERELLESAAADGLPADAVRAAWSRFALSLGTTATLARVEPARGAAGSKFAHSTQRAIGWASLGAVGGGLVTAALFMVLGERGGTLPPPFAPASSIALATASPSTEQHPHAPLASSSERDVPRREEADSDVGPPRRARPRPRDGRELPARASTPRNDATTSLAAEIALLDAVRRASRAGEFERALALLDRYRHEHSDGTLRRESDVLTMEALSLRGDHEGAAQVARRFLDAFPDDPHVARVRAFVH